MDTWEHLTLLLLNSQPDTITLLTDWFGALGSRVHYSRTLELCERQDEARALIETVAPDVILFDLAIPYKQNWQCFTRLGELGIFGDRPVIVTTSNRRAVDQIVGPTDAFEILGTPHDLWNLQELIEWKIAARKGSPTEARH